MPTDIPTIISGVSVNIDVSSGKGAIGVDVYSGKGVISDNTVEVDGDNLDGGEKNYGFYLRGSINGTVTGNIADLVNNTANDIGFLLDANTADNHGSNNNSYRVGTSITDNGSNNAVTVNDI